MTKAESRTAAKDGWRVRDDFGAIGKVVSFRDGETVLVRWDGEAADATVHHNRIERAD